MSHVEQMNDEPVLEISIEMSVMVT
jgi:hypothetical protein